MKRKLLALTLPIGLLIELVYKSVEHFTGEIPDAVGYPVLIVSCVFMFIGCVYHGYCFGSKRSPYDFK